MAKKEDNSITVALKGRFGRMNIDVKRKYDSTKESYVEDEDGEYKVLLAMDKKKDAESIKTMQKAIIEVAKVNKLKLTQDNCKFKDGDTYVNSMTGNIVSEDYPYLENCFYIEPKSKFDIVVYDKYKKPLPASEVKAGDYGVLLMKIAYYKNGVNRGVTAYLQGLMKLEDGDPLGGSADTSLLDSFISKETPSEMFGELNFDDDGTDDDDDDYNVNGLFAG